MPEHQGNRQNLDVLGCTMENLKEKDLLKINGGGLLNDIVSAVKRLFGPKKDDLRSSSSLAGVRG
jgi:hypothetical protein